MTGLHWFHLIIIYYISFNRLYFSIFQRTMMTKLERDNNNMKVAVRLRAHQQTNQSVCIQVNETNIFLNNSEHYKYDYVFDELSTVTKQ